MSRHTIMCLSAALLGGAAASVVLEAMPAAAQQQIEQVIVTARKREESILKTPVIEVVISGAQLRQYQTNDLKSLETQVPGLLVGSTIGSTGTQISLRGVGTSTLNAGIDQSVSLDLDGLQVSQGLAYYGGMFDVAQVEVLKGPQALFYGKSSPGGVVSLHSTDPTDVFELIARAAYEPVSDQKQGEFIVSGPVTDTLALRLATLISGETGYFNNTAVGDPVLGGASPRYQHAPNTDHYIIRGTAIWNPIEALQVKLKANYTEMNLNGTSGEEQYSSCPGGVSNPLDAIFGFNVPFLSPTENCRADRNFAIVDLAKSGFPFLPNNGVPYLNLVQIYGTLEADYKIENGLTLTSLTGFYHMQEADVGNDGDSEEAGPTVAAFENFHRRDWTEELRLTSEFSSPVNFTAGAFIQDARFFSRNTAYTNLALPFPFTAFPPTLIDGREEVNIHTTSLFGQLLWKIIPEVEFSGGARWTYEERTLSDINYLISPEIVQAGVPKISSYHLNPEFSLTYTPTDELTVYASYKQASKSGSFNTSQPVTPGGDVSFRDEGAKGEEGGIKGLLLDHTLSFNVDGYHYDYTNLQVGEAIVQNGQIISETLNAASSEVYGIEFQGTYDVPEIEGLDLHADVNWNHARFSSFPAAPCWGGQTISQGCNQDFNPTASPGLFAPFVGAYTAQSLSGRPLIRAPEWTTTFGFDYSMPAFGDWTLSIGSNTNFTSQYQTDLIERGDTVQRAFFKTNLNITLKSPGDDWELAFIGNDLNDAIMTSNCINAPLRSGLFFGGWKGTTISGPFGQDQIACNFDPGRELWLRATYRFSPP
jgi:iron complex outermembrane receptor protein